MDKELIRAYQEHWRDINEPIGKELGYPDCCIAEFCNDAPELLKERRPTITDVERYQASFIFGKYTGFIPCAKHAKMILSGEITLCSLIKKDRNPEYPEFPHA